MHHHYLAYFILIVKLRQVMLIWFAELRILIHQTRGMLDPYSLKINIMLVIQTIRMMKKCFVLSSLSFLVEFSHRHFSFFLWICSFLFWIFRIYYLEDCWLGLFDFLSFLCFLGGGFSGFSGSIQDKTLVLQVLRA